jgi:two-component system, sensor histidine kinase and response regulator
LSAKKNLLTGSAEASNILLTETDFNKAISKTLSILGEKTAVDRVYLFKNSYDKATGMHFMSQVYEWVRENISPQIDNPELQLLPYYPVFSDWYELFSKGDYFWSLVENLPEDKKKIMQAEDILSILEVPIKIKNELWGFIGFDDCSTNRTWDESEISILKAAAGSIGGAIERERTNNELIAAKENAEEMNRLKSNFLANMSHELRTPLIAILGYAELLASESENNDTRSILETIHSGGTRLLETLNLILDLSKIESGKVIISPEHVNIREMISETVELFKTLALKKGIYLKANYNDDNLIILLDKRFLRSVLNNLIGNAIKFTNKGGVTIDIALNRETAATELYLKISDTGIGIPESSRKVIFDSFRQASEGFNRQYEGTGLGLTITKKYVELMNGTIDVESEVGKGTDFIVMIPVVEAVSQEAESNNREYTAIPEVTGKPKVIFVDDDAASRSVLSLFLRKLYDVDVASTGEEAVAMMKNINYNLILLDISLGKGINGLDLIKLIRKSDKYSKLPVMAVTAHAMVGDRERFLNEGFDDYIAKPFTKDELLRKMRILVDATL